MPRIFAVIPSPLYSEYSRARDYKLCLVSMMREHIQLIVIYMRQNVETNLWFKLVACKQITSCIGSKPSKCNAYELEKDKFSFLSRFCCWRCHRCMFMSVRKIFERIFHILKRMTNTLTRVRIQWRWCRSFSVGSMNLCVLVPSLRLVTCSAASFSTHTHNTEDSDAYNCISPNRRFVSDASKQGESQKKSNFDFTAGVDILSLGNVPATASTQY